MTEKTSSLFDNEVKEEEINALISDGIKQSQMRSQWFYYETIRDAIRGDSIGSPDLSAKIMQAIDEEPTQMGRYNGTKEIAIEGNSYYWPLLLGLMVLFAIGLTAFNFSHDNAQETILLVYEEMPADIMNAHYANTSSTATYFVQTSKLSK